MAKMLLSFLACFYFLNSFSQNLVVNTGFEERNICVEYGVKCAPEGWFFLPRYARMAPVEPDSNHYELLLMGDPKRPMSIGNFIYTKLLCPLVAGEEYQVKFRIHTRGVEFDYLDIWTGQSEPWKGQYSFSRIKSSYLILPENITGDNLKSWREVTFSFKAKGGERYFMLGNISQKELTRGRKKAKRKPIEYGIDDISLLAANPALPKCAEFEAIKDQVYRNDFRHPGRWVENVELDSTLITGYKKPDTSAVSEPPVVVTHPPKTDTLIIPDVLFKFDKSDLNPKFINRLDSFVTAIQSKSYAKLLVAGHTDNYGTDEYNIKLSQDRANTIRLYLLDKLKIKEEFIEAIGYGESQPRATNATSAGRQQNRRVEIIIYY